MFTNRAYPTVFRDCRCGGPNNVGDDAGIFLFSGEGGKEKERWRWCWGLDGAGHGGGVDWIAIGRHVFRCPGNGAKPITEPCIQS